ncbi:MAG: hypothetical protein QM627_00270 [Luteolibacter sp.]
MLEVVAAKAWVQTISEAAIGVMDFIGGANLPVIRALSKNLEKKKFVVLCNG